jgi:HEAT repeat protein
MDMQASFGRLVWSLGLLHLLTQLVGCAEGPFAEFGSWNPWTRQEWAEDEQYGPTYHRRIAEIKTLRRQAADLTPGQQEQFIVQLTDLIRNDPHPVIRAEAVRTLSAIPNPGIVPGLQAGALDSDPNVRIATCQAWSQLGGPQALEALAETVQRDADLDVKIAATAELGKFQDQLAVQALGIALNDSDPALQYQAVQSLKSASGRNLGDSVPAWREFVAGRPPLQEDQPSMVERLRRFF